MYFPENMTAAYFFFDTYPGYFLQALPIALLIGGLWAFRLRKNHIFEDVKWSFGAGARCECVRQNYVGGGGYPQSIHGRVEKKCGTGVSDTGTVSVFYL